ncbi:MAG: M56 family metallopeptidase [Limisphaerales bacterium]
MNWPIFLASSPAGLVLQKWTALLALGWVTHWLLRNSHSRWRLIIWRGTLCLGLALPLLQFIPFPKLRIPIAGATVKPTYRASSIPAVASVESKALSTEPEPQTSVVASSSSEPAKSDLSPPKPVHWERIILCLWASGCVWESGRLFRLHRQLFRLRKETCQPSPNLHRLAKEIQARLGVRRGVQVQTSDAISSPFVCGLLKPAILLPRLLAEQLSSEEISALLSHELAHLRQHDLFWCLAWRWMKAVCWFHPLVWKIPAAHNLACEEEADRIASGQLGNQDFYARLLARLALRVLALPAMEAELTLNGSSQIARRLHHLRQKGIGAWNWKCSAAGFGLVALLSLITVGCEFSKRVAGGEKNFVEINGQLNIVEYQWRRSQATNGVPEVKSVFQFRCIAGSNEWRIQNNEAVNGIETIYFDGTNEWRIQNNEAVNGIETTYCDGTNQYQSLRKTSEARGGELPMATPPFKDSSTNDLVSIDIFPGISPIGDLGVTLPWLAFCSGSLLQDPSYIIPLPSGNRMDPDTFAYSDTFQAFADSLGLPKRADLLTSKEQRLRSVSDPRFHVLGRLPDFDTNIPDGKVRFHYEVLATTNFGGHTFPLEFKYSDFAPDDAGRWHLQSTGFGRVSSIKEAIRPRNVFEPGHRQSINDRRFRSEYLDMISYSSREIAEAPPTNDTGLQKIFAEEELRRKAGLNREPVTETAGIGVLLMAREQDMVIEEALPNSAAAAQHLHNGDRIVAVAQGNEPAVPVRNKDLSQAVQLIRGQEGTTVRLTIVPSGEDDSHARVVSLVRAELPMLVNSSLLTQGTQAPETTMVWLGNGTSERLSDFAGKIVVVEFWATWSAPCEKAMADLQSYFARNPDWKDKVILIAASVDDVPEAATKQLKAKGWDQTHNVWVGADAIKAWHIGAIPRAYVIDRQGMIVAGNPGDIPGVVNRALDDQHAARPITMPPLPLKVPDARAASNDMSTNSLPDLMRMLQQDQSAAADESRDRVLFAIVRLGPKAKPALPVILPLLTNQNRQLKIHALFALNAISPDTEIVRPFVPALMQTLGDEDWTIRLAVLKVLAALRPPPPEAAQALLRLLNDPEDQVRSEAMYSLVNQTNPIVIPMLDKRLHDRDSFVVTRAAVQIGVFGAAAATSEPQLRELLDAPVLTVRQAASNALLAITGQSIYKSAPAANADITYGFPAIPIAQLLSIYEDLAGKKVAMETTPNPSQTLRVLTVRPLTKSQALQLLEEVLQEQAGIVIVHGADGSLTAVAKSK